ncbi:DUF3052 domain-containing protein [Streptomyces sp. NPDC051742]|uniref:DUF3052 domain-containing protein n=1 Tax=unclassified Streptomyces TaxID=2593676 RepID=UPI0034306851
MLAEERTDLAARLGFQPGQVVQEFGYDEDTDQQFREAIKEVTGKELVDEEYADLVDAVIIWFRDDNERLADVLGDASGLVEDGAPLWLLTPKTGREKYIDSEVIHVATSATGLLQVGSVSAGKDWSGLRLAPREASR